MRTWLHTICSRNNVCCSALIGLTMLPSSAVVPGIGIAHHLCFTHHMCIAETGSTDSQGELSLGEKRSLRIRRRQQRQMGGEEPDGDHTTHGRDAVTAAASSPMPRPYRAPDSPPTGRGKNPKALGLRSRLADQSGPVSDDSDSIDADAGNGAAVHHSDGQDVPSTALTDKPMLATRTAQKRKRQQQQQQSAAVAMSVQLTRSTEASNRLDADAMTEHSRSSEAATPVCTHRRRGAQLPKPEAVLQGAQQREQELESEQTGFLRRTGRQRKLTPAAAAAVEEFPSLYRNPAKPPPTAQKAKHVRSTSSLSPASDQDWHVEAPAVTPRRGQLKQTHTAAGNGVSQVQMSQLVRSGVLPAGTHELLFMGQACAVDVLPDGMY